MIAAARLRIAWIALAVAGCLVCDSAWALAAFYLAVVLGIACVGKMGAHARFLMVAGLPLALLLGVMWGLIVQAPPGQAPGTSPGGGWAFAALTTTRALSVSAVVQLGMLPITHEQWAVVLQALRIPRRVALSILGTLAVLPDLRLRATQILLAARGRGYLTPDRLCRRIALTPTLLAGLTTWSLRLALQRSDAWRQRRLEERVAETGVLDTTVTGMSAARELSALALAVAWLAGSTVHRVL